MTAEEIVIEYLDDVFEGIIPVSGMVPSPMPEKFVTVEKTGSSEQNFITTAKLAVQSWAKSQHDAMMLNEAVKMAMRGITALTEVSACRCSTDYNFTDTTTNRYRYQALFEVVYYSA